MVHLDYYEIWKTLDDFSLIVKQAFYILKQFSCTVRYFSIGFID